MGVFAVVACLLVLASHSSLHICCVALHESLSFCLVSSRLVPRRQRQLSSRSSCLFLALCHSWFAAFAPVASWGRPSLWSLLVVVFVTRISSGHQLFPTSHPPHVVCSVRTCTVLVASFLESSHCTPFSGLTFCSPRFSCLLFGVLVILSRMVLSRLSAFSALSRISCLSSCPSCRNVHSGEGSDSNTQSTAVLRVLCLCVFRLTLLVVLLDVSR